jgi:hypothetical protein
LHGRSKGRGRADQHPPTLAELQRLLDATDALGSYGAASYAASFSTLQHYLDRVTRHATAAYLAHHGDTKDLVQQARIRSIHEFRSLLDVSAVTYPASPTTTIGVNQSEARAHRVAKGGQLSARRTLALLASGSGDPVERVRARLTPTRQAVLRGRVRDLLADQVPDRGRGRCDLEAEPADGPQLDLIQNSGLHPLSGLPGYADSGSRSSLLLGGVHWEFA